MPTTLAGTIYFDNAATTAPLPPVIERVHQLMGSVMGNSSSVHRRGRQAQQILDQSHETLGRFFDVPPNHVVFTSGGTESNNLAIWGGLGGLADAFRWIKSGSKGRVLTTTIEHSSVGGVFETLEDLGAPVSWVNVNSEGLVRMDSLEEALSTGRLKLASLHHVQSEIGIVQDIAAITRAIRAKHPDALIHLDAVQSYLKVPVRLSELGVDLISLSAHKLGGPKGVGALILGRRFESRNPKLGSLFQGASHQWGMRPGTVPVPLIAGMISACEWGEAHFAENRKKLLNLRQRLLAGLPPAAVLNGPLDATEGNPRRAPQTINFSVPGLPSAVIVEELSNRNICVSAGSACHSTNPRPNETLMAMGVGEARALSAIRVSLSPFNTEDEVDVFLKTFREVILELAS